MFINFSIKHFQTFLQEIFFIGVQVKKSGSFRLNKGANCITNCNNVQMVF